MTLEVPSSLLPEKSTGYMAMVKHRQDNENRHWCRFSSQSVIGEDPNSARERLVSGEPVTVATSPRFKLKRGNKIYTIGSCFARNIERVLMRERFVVPTGNVAIPPEFYSGATPYKNTILNKYNAHSMAVEILRGLEDNPPLGLIELENNLWYDPQTSFVKFLPQEQAEKIRRDMDLLAKEVARSDAVFLTLGLTETWYDTATGQFLNSLNVVAVKDRRKQTAFFNATVNQVVKVLSFALDALRTANPLVKVLITVSPVPMGQTFTGMDVISANTYSKATLRAACQQLYDTYDFVDYFPSYEMVTHSPPEIAWQEDRVHVLPAMVESVTRTFVARYVEE